jgi:ADP-ribosylglycohydrolase
MQHFAVKYKSAGVNAAHRASPLACMPTLGTMDDLIRCVREETEITHRHPQAAEVSVLSTVIIRLLIEGKSISDAIEQCSQLGKSMSFVSQIAVTGAELPKNNGGFAPDVLQACMYFVRTAEGMRL